MNKQNLLDELRAWWESEPLAYPREPQPIEERVFFQTGDELIARIVRSIQLNQSVVLSGPRGCGKSRCIHEAIKRAEREGIIPSNAWIKVQGNKEIPRDYLSEDGLGFRFVDDSTVNPVKLPAPFLKFALRKEQTGEPIKDGKSSRVPCAINLRDDPSSVKRPVPRFVVFLDEINRFSDGVLDSLLTVLEERTVLMAGEEYKLPVVVCMTMNPPGYDATARKLSPPLAARIGRAYRLYTPDLDTLSDVIMHSKLREQAEQRFDFALEMLGAIRAIFAEISKHGPVIVNDNTIDMLIRDWAGKLTLCDQQLSPELTGLVNKFEAALVNQARARPLLRDEERIPQLKVTLARISQVLGQASHKRLSPTLGNLARNDLAHLAETWPERLSECVTQLQQVIELEELFPNVLFELRRRIALVTLCLWGDVPANNAASEQGGIVRNQSSSVAETILSSIFKPKTLEPPRPGLEYLTDPTANLLRKAAGLSSSFKNDVRDIGKLCHFGPDGRAASDWLLTAMGVAIERSRQAQIAAAKGNVAQGFSARAILVEDLVSTVVECLAHKIYDKFSSAGQPNLTLKKEQAVIGIARTILTTPDIAEYVKRVIDFQDGRFLWLCMGGPGDSKSDIERFRELFIESGVTNDQDVFAWIRRIQAWLDPLGKFSPQFETPSAYSREPVKLVDPEIVTVVKNSQNSLRAALQYGGDEVRIMLPGDAPDSDGKARPDDRPSGFSHERWRTLCAKLAAFTHTSTDKFRLCAELATWKNEEIAAPVRTLREAELFHEFESLRILSVRHFRSLCPPGLSEPAEKALAKALDQALNLNGGPGDLSSVLARLGDEQELMLACLADLLRSLQQNVLVVRGREAESTALLIEHLRAELDAVFWRDLFAAIPPDHADRPPNPRILRKKFRNGSFTCAQILARARQEYGIAISAPP